MQMSGSFNANQFDPKQTASGHPPALKEPFTITSTAIKENSSKDGGFFEVEFTSGKGSIIHRYNIWNKSAKAVEIAHGQLSALCRAVNIYQVDWQNEGAALRGGRGLMDVAYQAGEEPSPDNPNAKGYTELKRVYDAAGNEPGKPTQQASQPQASQGSSQPLQQQQPGGAWGTGQSQPQNPSQQPSGGWQQPSQNQPAQPNQNQSGQAWQPGGTAPASNPPWGSRT